VEERMLFRTVLSVEPPLTLTHQRASAAFTIALLTTTFRFEPVAPSMR